MAKAGGIAEVEWWWWRLRYPFQLFGDELEDTFAMSALWQCCGWVALVQVYSKLHEAQPLSNRILNIVQTI